MNKGDKGKGDRGKGKRMLKDWQRENQGGMEGGTGVWHVIDKRGERDQGIDRVEKGDNGEDDKKIASFLEEIEKIDEWGEVEEIKQRLIDEYCEGDGKKYKEIPEEIRFELSRISKQELEKGRGGENTNINNIMLEEEKKIEVYKEGENRKGKETKVEKINKPWEEESEKEGVRLYEELAKKFELEKDRKTHIEGVLQKETDDRRIEFALKWFDDHKVALEKEGISIDVELSRDRMAEIAIEKGAFDDLEKNKKYKKDLEEIENMYAMRTDFGKGINCSIEGQFLILNTLDKRAEKTEKELRQMINDGRSEIEIGEKQKEFDELFEDKKELTAKIKGMKREELEKECENKIGPLEGQDSYIERLFEERKENEEFFEKCRLLGEQMDPDRWERMTRFEKSIEERRISEKIDNMKRELKGNYKKRFGKRMMTEDEKKILSLMNAGYNIKELKLKGLRGGTVELIKNDGTKEKKEYKGFLDFVDQKVKEFDSNIEAKTKETLEEEWSSKKIEYDNRVKREIEGKIKEIVESPEKAGEGIEVLFDSLRGKLISEFLREGVKKEKKTAEEIEKLRKYEEEGEIKNPYKLITEVIGRKKGLDKLSGGLESIEEDSDLIAEYLRKNQGIEASKEDVERFIREQKENGINLEKVLKSEKSLLDYFIELVFSVLKIKEENKEKI